jgi:hypothetical protein
MKRHPKDEEEDEDEEEEEEYPAFKEEGIKQHENEI